MWFRSERWTKKASMPRRRQFQPQIEVLEDRCLFSGPGSLDLGFGSTGVVATSLSKSPDTAWTSLLQGNGDIVTAGLTVSGSRKTPSFALVAHTPGGSLDTTFGSGGVAITASSNISTGGRAAAAQYSSTDTAGNANKIVMVGNSGGGTSITLARYNANGTLDTAFGSNGLATTPVNGGAYSVAIQPADGKIVVGGWYTEGPSPNTALLLLRYNANGSLDTTFGNNGEVITYPVTGPDQIVSVVVQPDGKIVAGGSAAYDTYYGTTQTRTEFTLVRYNSNGSLDTTFGTGGIVHTLWPGAGDGSGAINALALQGNGQIVAVGVACPSNPGGNAWGLARYNSDGSLDTTFGGGGLVSLDTPVSYDFHNGQAQAVAVQPNGELAVLGSALDANFNHTFALATVTATGSLDTVFGASGFVLGTSNSATASMGIRSVLVQPADGKIVVTGALPDSSKQGASDFALARYIGTSTAPQISSFTLIPSPVTSGNSTTLTASNITDPDPGSTINQISFYYFDSNNNKVVLGTGTQTSPGIWTFTFTVNLVAGTYTLYTQAEDNYGAFGNPVPLTLTVQPILVVSGFAATATAGQTGTITVTAMNNGTIDAAYAGTVHFTSSDPQAVLPSATQLTNGSGSFSVTLKTAGVQSITAADISSGITGSESGITIIAGPATHFSLSAPASVLPGVPFYVTVMALDAYGNPALLYSGIIAVAATDPNATLPSPYAYNGDCFMFSMMLMMTGPQTITIDDLGDPAIAGTWTIIVN
jgi:uncharacterized delta-60 repeat protein